MRKYCIQIRLPNNVYNFNWNFPFLLHSSVVLAFGVDHRYLHNIITPIKLTYSYLLAGLFFQGGACNN